MTSPSGGLILGERKLRGGKVSGATEKASKKAGGGKGRRTSLNNSLKKPVVCWGGAKEKNATERIGLFCKSQIGGGGRGKR